MKHKSTFALTMVLLFVFVFTAVLTVHSDAWAKRKADDTCCKYAVCGWTPPIWAYGVWSNGHCVIPPPTYPNPNDCPIYVPPCP